MLIRSEPLALNHVEIIFHEIKGNVAQYFYNFRSVEETEEWVRKSIKEHEAGGKEEFVYFDEDTFIGMVSPAFIESHIASIGMWVATSKQGMGYGKSILLDVLDKLKQRGITSVIYETEAENLPSIRLAKSLGFDQLYSRKSITFSKTL